MNGLESVLEVLDLALRRNVGQFIALLEFAGQLTWAPSGRVEVIVSQLCPLLDHVAFEPSPIAGEDIAIDVVPLQVGWR